MTRKKPDNCVTAFIKLCIAGGVLTVGAFAIEGALKPKPSAAPEVVATVIENPGNLPADLVQPLAEDPARASRMQAECDQGGLSREECKSYWEAIREQALNGSGGESYGQYLERQRQRDNDLAFCRQNPDDWFCRNGQYSGKY